MSNMVVATNIMSINSHRLLKGTALGGEKASARLSSGLKINSAGDDAAGLAISEKMRAQIRGLDMATKNAQDGISMIQTADGALAEVYNMANRIRELTVQGANETNTQTERNLIADEIFQLTREIRETEDRVTFNGMKILKTTEDPPGEGEANEESIDGKVFQVGPNADQTLKIELKLKERLRSPYDLDKVSLLYSTHSMLNHCGLALKAAQGDNHVAGTSFNYTGEDNYTSPSGYPVNHNTTGLSQTQWISFMIGNADIAMENISKVRSMLGAYQNRLEHTIESLGVSFENLSASESRIRDADMAKEMMQLTKSNILAQAGVSMLSQANQAPNSILSLLR